MRKNFCEIFDGFSGAFFKYKNIRKSNIVRQGLNVVKEPLIYYFL